MAKYTLFVSNISSMDEIRKYKAIDPFDDYKDHVTPPLEVEADSIKEAVDLVTVYYDNGQPRHPVFSQGTSFWYYIKDGDSFRSVLTDEYYPACEDEETTQSPQ